MLAKNCMATKLEVGSPQMALCEAAQIMKDCGCGILPVVDHENLVGLLTDRDITTRAVARSMDPISTLVKDVMSEEVQYCYDDQSLEEIVQNLGDKKFRRLPVLNRKQRLVGMLSLNKCGEAEADAIRVEKAVLRGSRPKKSLPAPTMNSRVGPSIY